MKKIFIHNYLNYLNYLLKSIIAHAFTNECTVQVMSNIT